MTITHSETHSSTNHNIASLDKQFKHNNIENVDTRSNNSTESIPHDINHRYNTLISSRKGRLKHT